MKISIKLERDNLILRLDEEKSFDEQKCEVKKRLSGMKSFLENGNARFSYDGADLTFEQEVELSDMVDNAFGKEVSFCHKKRAPHSVLRHVMSKNERIAKRINRDLKAGEIVQSAGDIIVVGNVDPTAQIKAAGDIYVIGNLRGVAHAGCEGDESALVYAMGMNPVMIKIADRIKFNTGIIKENKNGIAAITGREIKVKLI